MNIGGILRIQSLECLLYIEELVHVVQSRVIDREVPTSVLVVRVLLLIIFVLLVIISLLISGNLAVLPSLFNLLEDLLFGLACFIIIVVIGAALLIDKFIIVGFLALQPLLFLFFTILLVVLKYLLSFFSHLKGKNGELLGNVWKPLANDGR